MAHRIFPGHLYSGRCSAGLSSMSVGLHRSRQSYLTVLSPGRRSLSCHRAILSTFSTHCDDKHCQNEYVILLTARPPCFALSFTLKILKTRFYSNPMAQLSDCASALCSYCSASTRLTSIYIRSPRVPFFTMSWIVASNSNVSGDGTTCVTRLGCLSEA